MVTHHCVITVHTLLLHRTLRTVPVHRSHSRVLSLLDELTNRETRYCWALRLPLSTHRDSSWRHARGFVGINQSVAKAHNHLANEQHVCMRACVRVCVCPTLTFSTNGHAIANVCTAIAPRRRPSRAVEYHKPQAADNESAGEAQ